MRTFILPPPPLASNVLIFDHACEKSNFRFEQQLFTEGVLSLTFTSQILLKFKG